MTNISKRRREGSRTKIKTMGDHKEFLRRITKTLYYGQLPSLPCLSLPVTEISCEEWSSAQRGRSLRRLHGDAAARVARAAAVAPCALVLAVLYLERLRAHNPRYLAGAEPTDLFLVSLMVGNKFLQDDGEDDDVVASEWAASGGLDLAHLNKLELEFLTAIDWNVYVSEKSFESGLSRLERRVALRQARARGFFTYCDLACACDAAAAARLARALAAALACLASLAALTASALLLLHAALQPAPRPAASPASPAPACNATVRLLAEDAPAPAPSLTKLLRCAEWQRRAAEPERNWYDRVVLDLKSFEPWSAASSAVGRLYRGSLVDPVQRWLERAAQYADADAAAARAGRCGDRRRRVRPWLNFSELGAMVVSVSDR